MKKHLESKSTVQLPVPIVSRETFPCSQCGTCCRSLKNNLLEQFHGTVIFATNLIENYDKAFETRIQHVAFQMPDASCRERIWKAHLPPELPLEPGLSFSYLAESIDDVCGRDIKNAVIRTAVQAALHNTNVTQQALLETVRRIKETRVSFSKEEQNVLNAEDKALLIKKAKQTLQQNNSSPEEYHGR